MNKEHKRQTSLKKATQKTTESTSNSNSTYTLDTRLPLTSQILQLQRTVGNQAIQRLLNNNTIQREPGDTADERLDTTNLEVFEANSSGGEKKFYKYNNDTQLISIPSDPDTVDTEVNALNAIRQAGIRAVEAQKVYLTDNEEAKVGIKMTKLDGVFIELKDVNKQVLLNIIIKHLNGEEVDTSEANIANLLGPKAPLNQAGRGRLPNLLADLKSIFDQVGPDDGVIIPDLQGIISPDGNFTIIDPIAVETFQKYKTAMAEEKITDGIKQTLDIYQKLKQINDELAS